MASPPEDRKPDLDVVWPPFLDSLDTDPLQAWNGLHQAIWQLLRRYPPSPWHRLTKEEKEDLPQEVLKHCGKSGFRVLRLYKNKGRPFSVWLRIVVANIAWDILRKRTEHESMDDEESGVPKALTGNPSPPPDPWLAAAIRQCLDALDPLCRALLVMAADGMTPREMVPVLGPPSRVAMDNKQVGDRLSRCRARLAQCLEAKNVDISRRARRKKRGEMEKGGES